MKHADALALAEEWRTLLTPACTRIEIAGSVRRKKPEVHDIELVAVPIADPDLFGEPTERTHVDGLLGIMEAERSISLEISGPRYKRILLPEGIKLDLFLVLPPTEWGVIFLIRTGSAAFSKHMVTPRRNGGALPSDCKVISGAVWRGSVFYRMPEEIDYFNFCGMKYIEPEDRHGRDEE